MSTKTLFNISKIGWFSISISRSLSLTATLNIGKERWLAYRLGPDYDEQLLWKFGELYCTIPETEEQRLEREEAELEDLWIEQEANRYTQWNY